METQPSISILIVNYNSGSKLRRCLKHLSEQSLRDFEIIIVDNASTDTSIDEAHLENMRFTLIEAETNLGFAAANNLGAQRACGDWIIFLNPDAYVERNWLKALVDASKRFPFVDAFGSTQLSAANPDIVDGYGDVFHALGFPYRGHFGWEATTLPEEGSCFAPCAAAAMYRLSTFNDLGGFDESFFCYVEDVDLGYRLRLSGGTSVQVRDAIVHHEGSGITGRHSDFTVYHGHRNRIWAFFKNTPTPLLLFLAPINALANIMAFLGAMKKGYAGTYWRACRDGYLGLGKAFAKRRHIQKSRKLSSTEIASVLTWSLGHIIKRKADIRPIERSKHPH